MNSNMVWVDLEMTGLDERAHRIIEIAVLVTDSNLNELPGTFHAIIKTSKPALAKMNRFVRKMHKSSGLLERVIASTTSMAKAEAEALRFIKKFCKKGEAVLCGNSVHVDRRFLTVQMPKFSEYLHYRIIDVSTIKELARRWYPKLAKFEKVQAHTALSDIRESLQELRFYRNFIFK